MYSGMRSFQSVTHPWVLYAAEAVYLYALCCGWYWLPLVLMSNNQCQKNKSSFYVFVHVCTCYVHFRSVAPFFLFSLGSFFCFVLRLRVGGVPSETVVFVYCWMKFSVWPRFGSTWPHLALKLAQLGLILPSRWLNIGLRCANIGQLTPNIAPTWSNLAPTSAPTNITNNWKNRVFCEVLVTCCFLF